MKASEGANAYMAERSLDDTEQWSCTPATHGDVPEGDELYDRKNDLFQLHNVIDDYPEIAAGLLKKRKGIMDALAAS